MVVLPYGTGQGPELGARKAEVSRQALKSNWPIAVEKKQSASYEKNCITYSCHCCEASGLDDQSSLPLRWRAWRWGSRRNLIPHHILPPGEVGAGGGYACRPSDPAPLLFLIRPRVHFFCASYLGSSLRIFSKGLEGNIQGNFSNRCDGEPWKKAAVMFHLQRAPFS